MLTIKELLAWLHIKPVHTLHMGPAGQDSLSVRIHGLIRLEPGAIQTWLKRFSYVSADKPLCFPRHNTANVDLLMVMQYAHHHPGSLRAGVEILDRVRTGGRTM